MLTKTIEVDDGDGKGGLMGDKDFTYHLTDPWEARKLAKQYVNSI
jgi:hypothetical protein